MVLPSTFVFANPWEFVDFVAPEVTNEDMKQKQNCAQRKLQRRLQHLQECNIYSKRKRLGSDFETKWDEILDMALTSGYEGWWKGLEQQQTPSGPDKDIMLLVEAFGDKELAWRFSRYPDIHGLFKQPYDYGKLLVFVMRWARPVNQGNTSVNETREDQLSEEEYPSGPQSVCEGPAKEPSNVVCDLSVVQETPERNVKRFGNGESPERKRVCLQSEPPDIHETISTEHAISTSVSLPDHEAHVPTSSKQIAIVGTPVPMEAFCTFQDLTNLSTNFQYCGQLDLLGTGDCVLEYFWTGFSAVELLEQGRTLQEEDNLFTYHRLSPALVEKVPYKDLVNSIKRSEIWKKQSQDCEGSECFTISFSKIHLPDVLPLATIRCTVPKEEAPVKTVVSQH